MLGLGRLLQREGEDDEGDGGDADGGPVEQLLQRVTESALLEDRREALLSLRDMLAEGGRAQDAFASMGYGVACALLRHERDDAEVARAALECLHLATTPDGRRSAREAQAAAVNAEQLARTPDAIALLLSVLEPPPVGVADFYARYHALQVLRAVLGANARLVQEAVLAAPQGVVRLMDLLGEAEVLRNEALLILRALAAASEEVQKIAAFQGAFDRLLAIVTDEGGMAGGIVVQDCLHLLSALLAGSAANQLMFRELGYLAQLPALLAPEEPAPGAAPALPQSMAPERAANLAAGLETARVLLLPLPAAPGAAARLTNEAVLMQHGLLPALLALATSADATPDAGVRGAGCRALAALARSSRENRDALAATVARVSVAETLPVVHAALRAVVRGESAAEAAGAEELVAAMCGGSAPAQAALVATVAPGAAHGFGGDLLRALLQAGGGVAPLLASSRAALALGHLVAGNADTKLRLLALPLPGQKGGLMGALAQRLATSVTAHGAAPEARQLVANFGVPLLLWLHRCPPAVAAFLASVSQTPFLVGAVVSAQQFGAGGTVVCGVCALLLGLCTKYAPSDAAIPPGSLAAAIAGQITLPRFFGAVEALAALAAAAEAGAGPPGLYLSPLARPVIDELAAEMRAQLAQSGGGGGGGGMVGSRPATPPSGKAAAAPAAAPFAPPTAAAAPPAARPANGSAPAPPPSSPKPAAAAAWQPPAPAAPAPAPAYGDAHAEMQHREAEALRARCAELEAEAGRARGEAANARAAARKLETDLEGLSSAYAALDAHAGELQAQLDRGGGGGGGSGVATALPAPAGVDEAEVRRREAAAADAARAEAATEGDAAMEDLMVCLGQEEAKVAALAARLDAAGVSSADVLAGLA
jgi:hypothetical protein